VQYKRKLLLLVILFVVLAFSAQAQRSTTYTYTPNPKGAGYFTRTGDAYLPGVTITSLGLDQPQDMYAHTDGNIYISDTGNRRIVVFDPRSGRIVDTLRHDSMLNPDGLWITADNLLYVADPRAKAVLVFDLSGTLLRSYSRPTQISYGDRDFAPRKIAVDTAGNMYIIAEGMYDGVIQLSFDGTFLGYFTSNRIELSFVERLQDLFFTDAQKANLLARVPVTFSNLYMNSRNILYTTSIGDQHRAIKKHNAAGVAIVTGGVRAGAAPVDIWVNPAGIMVAVFNSGETTIFSNEGYVIVSFGYTNQARDIAGLFTRPTSVTMDSDGVLWYLDGEQGFIQSYEPTDYISHTYAALELFDNGNYQDSIHLWHEVLKVNQVSQIAHLSIGKNYLFLRNYEKAMYHTKIANSRRFYSESYWEVRNIWLQKNIMYLVLALILIMTVGPVFRAVRARLPLVDHVFDPLRALDRVPLLRHIAYQWTVLKKPGDGFYYLRTGKQGGALAAALLFLLFFAAFLLYIAGKGFVFQTVFVEDIDFASVVLGFFGGFFLVVLSNYLGTSIHDGRGDMKDVFIMLVYCLGPLTAAMLVSTGLSHVLTLNEVFAMDLVMLVGTAWSVILLFIGIQEVHEYGIKETFVSIGFTLMFVLVLLVVMVILTVIGQQVYQFFIAIGKELLRNVL